MTTKAYYTKEVVRDFIARVMKEAGMLGVTFSQGCQIHPDRLEASAESMTKLMNWICYSRVVDHKDSVQEAKSYAARAVEDIIKHPTRKFKLNAEWRQFSWWALRVIDCTDSTALTTKDEWEQWVKDHNLTGQRTAPEYNADRDKDAPDGERDEDKQPEGGDQPDDEEGDGDGDDEPEDEQPEGEEGAEDEPEGEPEKGDGGDAGDGKGEDDPKEQDKDGPDGDDIPPMPPMPPEDDDNPEEFSDQKTLLGFLWMTLKYGSSKVVMEEDDGEVVSILLMGPAGIGKTFSVKKVAKVLGAEVFVITAGQRVTDYLGYTDAEGVYHPSPMIKAIWEAQANPDKQVIILFDELDMTPADVSGVLFSLFASRELETLHTGKITCPKNLTLVAAMNTFGDGANDDFAGRTPVDKAMLDRFAFPYVAEFEEATARRLCKDSNLVDLILDWNQACMESGMTKAVLSYRSMNSFKMALNAGFSHNYALGKIVMGQTRDTLDTIWDCMKENKSRKYWTILKECIQAVPETR